MKIRFTATRGFEQYHDIPVWKNGDEREVPDAEAKRRIADFPANFSEVVVPVVEKKAVEDAENKAVDLDDSKNKGHFMTRKRGR